MLSLQKRPWPVLIKLKISGGCRLHRHCFEQAVRSWRADSSTAEAAGHKAQQVLRPLFSAGFPALPRMRKQVCLVFTFTRREAGKILFDQYRQLALFERLRGGYGYFLRCGPVSRRRFRDLYDKSIRGKTRAWLPGQGRGFDGILEAGTAWEGNRGADTAVGAERIDLLSGEPKTYGVVLNAEFQGEMSEFEW
jgi:hypothetical protein